MKEPAEADRPIVIDLGKEKRKRIKQLKQGQGPLVTELDATLAEVIRQLGDAADGKQFVPVVVVWERKPKRRRPFFPFTS
jgi:hypothetical protein